METIDDERAIELIKEHLEIDISTNISDFENVDCHIYEESTTDGYSVYVVTNNPRSVSICEDVYYYDHDLADAFEEQIRYGDETFYIDEGLYDDIYLNDKLVEMFVENVEDIIENEDISITLKEINQLKEEYGIEDEEEEPEVA
jgi:hypothetical protein